jgi:hypothetical protein
MSCPASQESIVPNITSLRKVQISIIEVRFMLMLYAPLYHRKFIRRTIRSQESYSALKKKFLRDRDRRTTV